MTTVTKTMEELRLKGNMLFASDPRQAADQYRSALAAYSPGEGSLDEYTKSAGNALTCLFKLEEYESCAALAREALSVNPLLAKAYAFIGRCALASPERVSLLPHEGPMQYLCRAVHLLPSIGAATQSSMSAALDAMLRERSTVCEDPGTDASILVCPLDCGNGVVAATPLPSNVALCSTLHPFAVCAYEETNGRGLCAQCGRVPLCAVCPCVHCGLVAYCTEQCAVSHAAQHTQYECQALRRLREMRERQAARASESNARKKDRGDEEEGEGEEGDFDDGDFFATASLSIAALSSLNARRDGHERFISLESHAEEISQSLAPLLRLIGELVLDKDNTSQKDRDRLARVVGIVRCNALEVPDASGLGVGQALHAASIVSYFNHSCAPNCAIDVDTIVTTRPIAPREELTIAYMPQLYWPAKLRGEELAGRYFFTCRCARCRAAPKDPFERALASVREERDTSSAAARCAGAVQRACAAVREKDVRHVGTADRDELLRLLRECQRVLYPFHYLCHELRNALSFVYAVLGDAAACRRSCLEELMLWEAILPGAHPVKRMKIRNALRCSTGEERVKEEEGAAGCLLPLVEKFAALYDVGLDDDHEGNDNDGEEEDKVND